ncbi:acetoacetate metabolism regulatory protein AtoC [compost metagenome]
MVIIGVCDNSKEMLNKMRDIVSDYLSKQFIEFTIYCYTSGSALLNSGIHFNIVFLDIEMDHTNGTETAKQLRQHSLHTTIIFIANYSEYQSCTSKLHAFQYITKPLKYHIVCEAIDEALEYMNEANRRYYFCFNSDKGLVKLVSSDIFYLEFLDRKIQIKTQNQRYFMNGTLCKLYEELKIYGFGMPHKSYIVNYLNICNIKGYEIKMENGDVLPMAQRKAVTFKHSFYNFLHGTNLYI